MIVSDKGVAFICSFEGFSAHPYKDPASGDEPITIGFGITVYPNDTKVTLHDPPVTKEQAMSFVKDHITHHISPWLDADIPHLIQQQYDSLCSFIYNVGLGNFQSSTLLKDIRKGSDCTVITKDMGMWVRAAGKVLPGLTKRRAAESLLYCTGSYGSL